MNYADPSLTAPRRRWPFRLAVAAVALLLLLGGLSFVPVRRVVNDIDAVGLTVDQLRKAIADKAAAWVKEPEVSVVVKAINSRRVSITGQVEKPGQYALLTRTTVMELITMAGGVAEYADMKKIRVTRIKIG